ncbi:Ig-like domain-containing protein [Algoriphagus sp. SE2]|uniref:Ig-like domain-containing protein n=1 Tax=Algoriphagus sp. SE2 TaxID=3141536 RepID=UPI0031CD4B41
MILLFQLPLTSFATDYYFSTSDGDDNRSIIEAQNPATPWKTIAKLNALSAGLRPGDRVLFKSGDVFYGTINVVKGGTSGSPITYTSYGVGAPPIITSLETIENWRSIGGGKYEASLSNLESSKIQIFEIDGAPQEIGRFPNSDAEESYLEIRNVLNPNSISGDFSFPNLAGAELVIRKNNWIIDRHPISFSSGTTINFEDIVTAYQARPGSGYFVQNHVSTLDKFGEWAYNPELRTISAFLGSADASSYTFQVATKDHLVVNQPYIKYITFRNLHFKGSNKSIFNLEKSGNFIVDQCILESAGENGFYIQEVPDMVISNNTVTNSLNDGIFVFYGGPRMVISNNIFENTMPFNGMARSSDLTGVGIYIPFDSDNSLIEKNQVINTGYNGIHFGGDFTIVKNNLVDRFCVYKQDGGGIYTNADNQFDRNNKGREIVGNIVLNGIGNKEGTEEEAELAHGIYNDDNSSGIKVSQNTVANINGNGYFVHNNNKIEISDNLIFKAINQLNITHDPLGNSIREMVIKNNTFSSVFDNEALITLSSIDYDLDQVGIIDENNFFDPYNRDFIFLSKSPSDATAVSRNLENWSNEFGYDENSKKPRFNIKRYNVLERDLIKSSTFDSDINFVAATYGGTGQFIPDGIDGGSLSIQPNPGNNSATYIQIGPVEEGEQILLEFDSRSSLAEKEVSLFLENSFNVDQKSSVKYFATTTEAESIQIGFTALATAGNESIVIKINDPADAVIFDNMSVSKVTAEELDLREFLYFNYNYSDEPVTLPLSGVYRNAKNELIDNEVTIPPYGSVLLVKLELSQLGIEASPIEIAITDPVQDQEFFSGQNVPINTEIIDLANELDKVWILQGDSVLARIFEPPYSFTWPNPSPGSYNLRAIAFDTQERVTVSDLVTINVLEEALTNLPPTVSIQNPSNNQSIDIGNDITISAFPEDADGTIDRVEIFVGNTLIGTANAAPYEVTWTPTDISSYTISARAYDNEGAEGVSQNVIVNITEQPVDNLPPAVQIITPLDGQNYAVGQDVFLQTNASDPENRIDRVEFLIDDWVFATTDVAPYDFNYPNAPAGTYTIRAKIYDEQGLSSESSEVTLNVLSPDEFDFPPIITIQQPIDPEVVINSQVFLDIKAAVTDPENDLDRVEIYSNDNLIANINAEPFEFEWLVSEVIPGTYLVYAIAYDNSGNSTQTKSITVHIFPPVEGNLEPTISITQPSSNQTISYQQNFLITTNPYDPESNIEKVEIFADGALLASLTEAPYDYEWSNIPIGVREIYAVVTDDIGQTGISETVNLNVVNYAPTISIVDPIDGQTFQFGDDVLIKTEPVRFSEANRGAPIYEEDDIERVEFFYNEQIFAIVTEAPFEYNWESPPAGTYTLKTKVFDNFGLSSESQRPVIQILDNQPPVTSIVTPSQNQTFNFGEDILIQSYVADPENKIALVEFLDGDVVIGSVTGGPYEINWQNASVGIHGLKTRVTDQGGLVVESSVVNIEVIEVIENLPPVTSIVTPTQNQEFDLGDPILIQAYVVDPEGEIALVEFLDGNTVIGSVNNGPYEINWTNASAGSHELKSRVTDQGGLVTESSVVTIEVIGGSPADNFSLYLNAGNGKTVIYEGKEFIGDKTTTPLYYNYDKVFITEEASTDELYQSGRRTDGFNQTLTYNIPVPNGTYKVSTHHIELQFGYSSNGGPGDRIFDIEIEGNTVSSGVDIMQAVGTGKLKLEFENIEVIDEILTINLIGIKHRPLVSGIAIEGANVVSSGSSIGSRFLSKPTILASPLEGTGPLKVDFMGDLTGVDQGNLSYSYEFEDGTISSEKNPTHLFVTPGSHEVKVTVRDGNELVSQETITIQVNKSKDAGFNTDPEFGKSSIRMYPNPADDLVNLQSTNPEEKLSDISIFDVRGRLVQTYLPEMVENEGNKYTISVRSLAAGVYFLTTTTEEGVSQLQRLIVVK